MGETLSQLQAKIDQTTEILCKAASSRGLSGVIVLTKGQAGDLKVTGPAGQDNAAMLVVMRYAYTALGKAIDRLVRHGAENVPDGHVFEGIDMRKKPGN